MTLVHFLMVDYIGWHHPTFLQTYKGRSEPFPGTFPLQMKPCLWTVEVSSRSSSYPSRSIVITTSQSSFDLDRSTVQNLLSKFLRQSVSSWLTLINTLQRMIKISPRNLPILWSRSSLRVLPSECLHLGIPGLLWAPNSDDKHYYRSNGSYPFL
jgi:hypothetical protein